jgi:hypothetical protein
MICDRECFYMDSNRRYLNGSNRTIANVWITSIGKTTVKRYECIRIEGAA